MQLVPLGFAAAAFAAGVWASLLSSPHPPAGVPIRWLPSWAAVVIGCAAVAGCIMPSLVRPPTRERRPARVSLPAISFGDLAARPGVLEGVGVFLALVAAAMWAIGAIRGFL